MTETSPEIAGAFRVGGHFVGVMSSRRNLSRLCSALALAGALSSIPVQNAQAALAAGDIAFVGYNSDGSDNFAFVALTDIAAGEAIIFEDNEWNGTGWVDANENAFIWTATSTVTAGTVVTLDSVSAVTPTASTGSIAYAPSGTHGSGRGIGNNDEMVYAYQGTRTAPTFITAVTNGTGGFTGANGSITGTGLTSGTNALDLNARDEDGDIYAWIGTRTGYASWAAVRAAINATPTAGNWNFQDANGDQSTDVTAPDVPFSTTGFTVNSLPTVNLSVSASTATEAAATVITVTATASAAVSGDQTVNLAVTGTGITAGDYTLSSPIITILGGMATGTATFTIQDDSDVEGNETATLTISSPSAGIVLGLPVTQNVSITDNDAPLAAPSFTLQPAPTQSVAYNATATLTAAASGNPTPSYQWYQGNSGDTSTPVGTASPSFTTPALTAASSYWVRASNGQGSPADSNTASITVTLSNISSLSALTLSSGTLAPTFASGTLAYTAGVSNATSSLTVTPTRTNGFATIQARVNGGTYSTVTSGSPSASLPLNAGSNTVDVLVTAQDGVATSTYTVTVTRGAPNTLVAGDLMFTAMNADEDGFAMVALKDIPANSTMYFCDNEWDGVSAFNTGEGYLQWDSGASVVAAGTVIRFLAIDAVGRSASVGSLTLASGSSGFSGTEESIYAYQSDSFSGTPAFVSAICNRSFGTAGSGSLAATGLSIGNGAIETGNAVGSDFAEFTASRSDQLTFAAYLPIVSNIANWTDSGDGVFNTTVPNTTAFTLASAPINVNLSVSASTGTEAGVTAITVTATASAPVVGDQTVSLAVTGTGITAGDYTLSNATITILDTQSTGSVTFTIQNDVLTEGTETATLTISSPSVGIVLGATTSQNVAITDNDSSIDLSKYVRVGRYDLPEPTRTTPPTNNLLAQEASGVTYNSVTDTLFIVGDGGKSVTQVSKTGVLIDTMTLALGSSPQGTEFYDIEGITYIGGGQFVMTEERDRQAVKFTYVAGGTLTRGAAQTVKLGTSIGNVGIEGLSYDPQTSGFIFAKESDPLGMFQTTIDFVAGTASNGSPSTVNSTNLFAPELANLEDMSDVFAFSNLPALIGQPDAGNLLILSQESGMIRNVDRSGNIFSTLTLVADAGNPLTIQNQTHEGVTMDHAGNIYVVSENGGGDTDHPQLWVYSPSAATNVAPTALALSTASTTIPENEPTTARIKMATIVVTDADGVGVNQLTVGGADAASFEIFGSGLYLKAGEVLSFTTKPTYNVTVNVDDTTVGLTPDASANFTLNLTEVIVGGSTIRVTEVAPWSSGNSPVVAADWFELTNTGATAVDITGWKMYDSGAGGFGSSGPLNGITSIAPGETVIFVDGSTKITPFITNWFGAGNAPSGLQIGYYGGPGLSTGGDAVNIYNGAGTLQTSVSFGASPSAAPFGSFDNTAGLNNTAITQLSALGSNGAFTAAATTSEIGSPGTATISSVVLVSITASDASAAEAGTDPGTFRISRTGSTTLAMDVLYSIATGAGQATSGDYTPVLTSPATIPAGQSFVDVTITPVDDINGEGSETVTLTLGDTGSYDVGSPSTATVTILDNDSPNVAPTAVALNNAVATITEITPTVSAIKVADIVITDDLQGTNILTVTGTDAAFFEITGSALYLKAGTTLSFATKPSYSVTVEVDDASLGSTPDASVNYNLAVLKSPVAGSIIVSEITPWSSTAASSAIAVDWYEVTNKGTATVDITGWKWNDSANSFTTAVALNGITSIAPGESVIFLQTADLAGKSAAFKTLWFGSHAPVGLQFGSYTGPGLSGGGDAVNIYDTSGNKITGVSVGASPTGPFTTFDNAQGLTGLVTLASAVGVNGAFIAVNSPNEIGSPGTAAVSVVTLTALQSWKQLNFGTSANSGLTADTADFDGDGISNLMEYALGIDSTITTGTDGLPALPVSLIGDSSPLLSDRLALSFRLDSPTPTDLTYTVQATGDLGTWVTVASKTGSGAWVWLGGGTSRIVTSGTNPVTVKIGDLVPTSGNPTRMMRLVVTNP